VSQVAISIQTLGSSKDTYLRKVVGSLRKADVLKAVEEMMDNQASHDLAKARHKSTWKAKQKIAALQGNEDVIPGMEVDAKVEHALA
jgi:hypothetical protein